MLGKGSAIELEPWLALSIFCFEMQVSLSCLAAFELTLWPAQALKVRSFCLSLPSSQNCKPVPPDPANLVDLRCSPVTTEVAGHHSQ